MMFLITQIFSRYHMSLSIASQFSRSVSISDYIPLSKENLASRLRLRLTPICLFASIAYCFFRRIFALLIKYDIIAESGLRVSAGTHMKLTILSKFWVTPLPNYLYVHNLLFFFCDIIFFEHQ